MPCAAWRHAESDERPPPQEGDAWLGKRDLPKAEKALDDHRTEREGAALLRDAVLRTEQAAGIGGPRAIVLHAVSEGARRFYERCGFSASPLDPLT